MDNNYGISRVLEPKGVVPATAWKVDNTPVLGDREALVKVERLHIEWDSFRQLCSSCSYDENKIKRKIMDIVEKRGKMHNPFTGTGGTLTGKVEAISDNFESQLGAKVGDRIYSLTSLCGVPLKLDSIDNIDYNYGQVDCQGTAVFFETSPAHQILESKNHRYTLAAMNEAACLYSTYELVKESGGEDVTIVGRNVCLTILYAAAAKLANPKCKVTYVVDNELEELIEVKEIEKMLSPIIDTTIYADLSKPTDSYVTIKEKYNRGQCTDLVIVAEDILGAETLGVFMAKEGGYIYFTTVRNNYAVAETVAETLGKDIHILGFDQYREDYGDFTLDVVDKAEVVLKRLDAFYNKINKPIGISEARTRSIALSKAGKDDDFVYQSKVTKLMVDEIMNVAKYDCNVIIQGETGVGKEKVLSLIHQNSQRHGNPCIKINCATIHENLAESEFFGYEPGAFTGAGANGKKGYFEMANNGILFLDEIGSLSMNMQSKLLRVLQENTFYRVGGTKQVSVNVRVIVANNVPLKDLVAEGKFREDLYYRLNICNIDVPPLRKRRDDITCLAETFTKSWAKRYGIEREISKDALQMLRKYNWPGNVRELENIIHRLVIGCKDTVITGEQVGDILHENSLGVTPVAVQTDFDKEEEIDFREVMDEQEKKLIEYALKKAGTTRKAAELIGLPQTTFARKKLKYNL